ncbi:WhiB family transcriptional regulator [Mycolicibacterium sp. ND9-15]|uniref:WhiB family transcriptional regulator n=1 Tax=Mycolicibacterium sp. ND9-15 TaxID=3042320 RepID=UPI002DDABF09|nr:WhiB family transcriptional regulator [Mycolicibacterium sp. ND9-15]WSE55504.1 WhiB family transcriptional regulator [Mycolicibacterium sp. ND9-15]
MPVDEQPTPRTARPVPIALGTDEAPFTACTRDPDRWAVGADDGAKELCRACPRRWLCAQEACQTSGASGVWAGIYIPDSGRARQFALRQLQSLAERNGFTVQRAS